MRKLLHFLFGIHYIAFDYGGDTEVRRIRTYSNGIKYVVAYGTHYYLRPNAKNFTNRTGTYVPLTWNANDKET